MAFSEGAGSKRFWADSHLVYRCSRKNLRWYSPSSWLWVRGGLHGDALKFLFDDRWHLVHTFDLRPELPVMSQVWKTSGQPEQFIVAAKGAPETIARLCRFLESRCEGWAFPAHVFGRSQGFMEQAPERELSLTNFFKRDI